MTLLVDKRYQDLRMEEISDMVGFSNRQSFYASFYRIVGITPRAYRLQHLQQHPAMMAKRSKKKSS
jgi:AraC-like DNA-binding protein